MAVFAIKIIKWKYCKYYENPPNKFNLKCQNSKQIFPSVR